MLLFILFFDTGNGCCNSCTYEIMGIYDTMEKAVAAMDYDMKQSRRSLCVREEDEYEIKELTLNSTYNLR